MSARRTGSFCVGLTLAMLTGCAGDSGRHAAGDGGERGLAETYATVRLTADLGGLTDNQRQMLPLLIDAARAMDDAFWLQAYGNRDALLDSLEGELLDYARWNYGPWDRLDDNRPFVPGVGAKPEGARFYPEDMTRDEFEQAAAAAGDGGEALRSLYTMVRRDADGSLTAVPYHRVFADPLELASAKLRAAARLAEDPGFREYLELRAAALLSGDYQPSDLAWMDMKDNALDVVIGPIETYEDRLFGYKAAFEAYVLIKDRDWSRRLQRYAALLPELQRGLPVPDAYKRETPGGNADLNAYDVVYYAGDCNAGSKTIAINLPNDEEVQLQKGSRRLQLKNAMRAKFDRILQPIAEVLIAPDQRAHVTFDAFFANTMFHEVAHGLGIKKTVDGSGTVRAALRDHAGVIEEGKADILGLHMVTRLHEQGELDGEASLEDHYVTFMASIFRSIRFGAASAHGKANMIRFHFFRDAGAFARGPDGTYRIDMDRMVEATNALSERLLRLQGDGDYAAVAELVERSARIDGDLAADLQRVDGAGIPVDIVFEQGPEVLGL